MKRGSLRFDEQFLAEHAAKRSRWTTGGNVAFDVPVRQPSPPPSMPDAPAPLPGARAVAPLATAAQSGTPIPLERDVLAAVLRLLAVHPRVAWAHRMNVGQMTDARGNVVRFAFKGCADILGQLRCGRFLAVECKHPITGRLTDDQREFLTTVARNGGVAIVARGVEDVERGLA